MLVSHLGLLTLGSHLQSLCLNAATPSHKARVKNLKSSKRVEKAFEVLFRCCSGQQQLKLSSLGSSGDLWDRNRSKKCPTVVCEQSGETQAGSSPPAQSGFTVRAEHCTAFALPLRTYGDTPKAIHLIPFMCSEYWCTPMYMIEIWVCLCVLTC